MDISERFLDALNNLVRCWLAVEDGSQDAEEGLERAKVSRAEIVRNASDSELREIAEAVENSGYMIVARTLGYEDVLEYFQTLQQGLRSGMSWAEVHSEHRSKRSPINARYRGV